MARPRTLAPRPEAPTEVPGAEGRDEERVREAIVDAVMSHRLPPGTRLVETPLTEAFGVSRSLLRRVLVRLANEKVVELAHNRGATVAQPSQAEMRDVFEVRRLLEGGILRALPGRAPRAALAKVRALVRDERTAFGHGEWSKWIRLSGEYHLQLARLLENAELSAILKSLIARTTLMIALYDSPGHNACSFDEHDAILDALETGDSERACALMSQHLATAERKLHREKSDTDVDLVALFGANQATS
jgi:DNA-binding GntR family transcriptional regulator